MREYRIVKLTGYDTYRVERRRRRWFGGYCWKPVQECYYADEMGSCYRPMSFTSQEDAAGWIARKQVEDAYRDQLEAEAWEVVK